MKIEEIETAALIPYARNSKRHPESQIKKIAASIKEFGFTLPILIDEARMIIAGHGRVEAASLLKMETVPCVMATGWADDKKAAYVLADNKLSELGEWDEEMLKLELERLEDDFDLIETLGFLDDELSDLLGSPGGGGLTEEDAIPELQEQTVSVLGDIWLLGNHRLMCGDSTSIDAVEKLMDGQKADMVFTDPPYGISVVGCSSSIAGGKPRSDSIGGSNRIAANSYRPVIGDDEDYDPSHIFMSFPDSKYILWGANYYCNKLPEGNSRWFVWDKNRGVGTTFSDCELAWSNIKGVVVKKYKCTWDGMNKEGESGKRVHPTQKPIKLITDMLTDFKYERKIVDLFGGSGSVLISCEQVGGSCFTMELDEKYVDVIVRRWQDFTGREAVHASGKTFAQISDERA